MSAAATGSDEAPTRLALFTAFLKIGVLGFGGVAAWARHVLVVERGFLGERAFAEAFGLASTLPGANTVNLSVMLGDRFRGPTGSAAALAGLMGLPLAILAIIALLYERFGGLPDVRAALLGAAAGAAGIVLGVAIRLLRALEPDLAAIATTAGVCLAAAVRVPMLAIVAVAMPVSIALKLARRP